MCFWNKIMLLNMLSLIQWPKAWKIACFVNFEKMNYNNYIVWLWKFVFEFNTFALVINFINSNWVPCHVIVGLFKVVFTSRVATASQFQHLLELFLLWWHVPLWHFVLYNKVLGFAKPSARLVNMFIVNIRKLDFSEGPTWLKCSHWPRGMVVLIKRLGHERHKLFLTETFNKRDFFDHVTNQTFGQKCQRSIKMIKA